MSRDHKIEDYSNHLVGLVGLHDERVAGRAPLLQAVRDHHEAVRGRLRPDVDARVLAPQQVLYERRLAWAPAQPRSGTARTLVLKTLGPGPMWMPGYSRPSRCFMNAVLPGRRHSPGQAQPEPWY